MTAKELHKLKKSLPSKWPQLIHKAIKGEISIRQIQRIVYGECEDKHGIIDIAVKLAAANKKHSRKLSLSLNKI